MALGLCRADFDAKIARRVSSEILAKELQEGGYGYVARLIPSLDGACDAAQKWTAEYASYLCELRFELGRASPCNFRHVSREIFVMMHGADFTVTAWRRS